MSCYPCSQGRTEDCQHLGLCPSWCCPVEDDDEDQAARLFKCATCGGWRYYLNQPCGTWGRP